jgi:hypothetical protein
MNRVLMMLVALVTLSGCEISFGVDCDGEPHKVYTAPGPPEQCTRYRVTQGDMCLARVDDDAEGECLCEEELTVSGGERVAAYTGLPGQRLVSWDGVECPE